MGECGFFGGSFDPFTVAHKSVVDRALPLFSRLVIGIGVNTAKRPWQPVEERLEAIRRVYAREPKVEVVTYDGLTVDAARGSCSAGRARWPTSSMSGRWPT